MSDEEYFAKIDREKKEKLRAEIEAEQAQNQAQELKKLHWHRCGKCGNHMTSHTFRGLEIEVCSACGAVLLEHGELEALAGNDQSGIIKALRDLFGG